MKKMVIEIFKKFNEPPESMSVKQHRFFVFINYTFLLAGAFHFSFVWIFGFFDLYILSVYNIISSLFWAIAIYLNLRCLTVLSIVSANIEVVLHATLCIIIIGWETGFHYYILSVPLIIFLSPLQIKTKIFLCFLNCISYSLLYNYSIINPPTETIPNLYLKAFNYFNIIAIFFSISFLAYYYRRIVLSMERKLEAAHLRTTSALSRLNENLDDAAIYVKTILPKPIYNGAVVSEWEFIPSESLGGDAFGYNWLDQDHFAIFLLDVSGHGVSAALLSATIMNVLRSNALPEVDFREPDKVLSALNRAFPSEDNNDMFFTIWYGVYNKSTRILSYSSAGHPPALLYINSNRKNQPHIELGTKNNVIGGFENLKYTKDNFILARSSSLYVFSDGVYEFLQKDGSRWKYKEFIDHMSFMQSKKDGDLDYIVRTIKKLNRREIFEDDFTLLKIYFN